MGKTHITFKVYVFTHGGSPDKHNTNIKWIKQTVFLWLKCVIIMFMHVIIVE